jgi:hypothetical protein
MVVIPVVGQQIFEGMSEQGRSEDDGGNGGGIEQWKKGEVFHNRSRKGCGLGLGARPG